MQPNFVLVGFFITKVWTTERKIYIKKGLTLSSPLKNAFIELDKKWALLKCHKNSCYQLRLPGTNCEQTLLRAISGAGIR